MNALTLFERVTSLWPAQVELLPVLKNASDQPWFPALARVNAEVEERIDFTTDHWTNVAAWSFYQAVTSFALERVSQGHTTLCIKSVPLELFHEYVRQNLARTDFTDERLQYTGM